MTTYQKPWLSYEQQLEQLKQRGLSVTDHDRALDYLQRIGYYRLSGYWYPFRKRGDAVQVSRNPNDPSRGMRSTNPALDEFKSGACFQDAVELYVFDKKLRLLLLDALERIEVGLRVDIAYTLGRHSATAYNQPEWLFPDFVKKVKKGSGRTGHQEWLEKHGKLISRSRGNDSIRHYTEKYGLPIPIWVVSEVWDFGLLSQLYSGMRACDQDEISNRYGIRNGRVFASWLRSMNYLRNVSAHHGRLWNKTIVQMPQMPGVAEAPWLAHFDGVHNARSRCFMMIYLVRHLLDVINPRSTWGERMADHLTTFPDIDRLGLNLFGMGAPRTRNWLDLWFDFSRAKK